MLGVIVTVFSQTQHSTKMNLVKNLLKIMYLMVNYTNLE